MLARSDCTNRWQLARKKPKTVGGSIMGKATTASTKNFHHQREKANQEASGKPRINNKSVVRIESRKLGSTALPPQM